MDAARDHAPSGGGVVLGVPQALEKAVAALVACRRYASAYEAEHMSNVALEAVLAADEAIDLLRAIQTLTLAAADTSGENDLARDEPLLPSPLGGCE